TNESWKDKQTGEQKERTEWHRVVMFDRLAEIAADYLHKGSQVYIEGKLQTRKWQDKDGNDRWTTEIRAHEMQMLGGKGGRGSAPAEEGEPYNDSVPFLPMRRGEGCSRRNETRAGGRRTECGGGRNPGLSTGYA